MSTTARKKLRVVLLVLLVGLVAVILIHSLSGRAALLKYKAELRARGEKLTVAELAIPISTNAEHIASRQIFFTNNFHLPTSTVQAMQFIAPGVARIGWQKELRANAPQGAGIVTNGEWGPLEEQNLKDAPSLDLFRQALRNPAPDGWDYHNERTNTVAPKMNYVLQRNIANGLLNAELIALHHADLDTALTNIHALIGLVRLNRNEAILVQPMISGTIADMGLRGTWEALQAPGWDDERLAALQQDWEQVKLFDLLERGFLGERANNQEVMSKVRGWTAQEFAEFGILSRNRVSPTNAPGSGFWGLLKAGVQRVWFGHLVPMGYKMFTANEDELVQLRYFSETLDGVRLLKADRPWAEVKAALEKTIIEVDETFKRDHLQRLMVGRVVIGNSVRAVEITVQRETQRRLTITAIAIHRYQLKYGKPPAKLVDLTPEFLQVIPIDPMSGQPLCYRANADGTFTLYSVDLDGKDDGGQAGIDNVWPVASTNDAVSAIETTVKRN